MPGGALPVYECGSICYENGSIMAYRLIGADFDDFISPTERIDASGDEQHANRITFATPKGDIQFQEYTLNPKLSILEGIYRMQDDVTISGAGDTALLEIQFNLSEKDISFQDKSNLEHITPARSGNIAFLAAEENEAKILLQKDVVYHTFDIHLPAMLLDHYVGESKLLDRFLAQIHNDTSCMLFPSNIRINPAIYNTIQDIKTCRYDGLTRKIYLESKAYELIALLYEDTRNQRPTVALGTADQERIHWAASIIRDNLEHPLTIMELSRRVGINQTKLKTGFKALFGRTVFGYLQDIRMHQAKRYLLDTQLSVQEIAMLLGYQNTSNFSIAFKNSFGYPPLKMREKRLML